MEAVKVVLTYADYVALPDDGKRYEILDGELSVTAAPGRTHQRAVGTLFSLFDTHVRARGLGEVYVSPFDVILHDTSIVQPDIVYVATARLGIISERGVGGTPTLAVEVISPSSGQIDRHTKLQLYARYGVPHFWIVDPFARSIDAHVLQSVGYVLAARAAGDEPLRAEPFPDLTIPLTSLWA
jgi:Uma2 family endonuclease